MQATDHSGADVHGRHGGRTARRWLLGLALGGTLVAPAVQAQLVDPIGFETCASGAALDAIACAGVATLSTPGGPPVAVAFDGRFGSSGSVGLFSDSGPVTIEFSPSVSDVRIDVLAAGAGATVEAFAAGGASLGSVPAGAAAQIVAAGIARIVVTDPDGEFALDQLQTTPEGALAGCPVYQDGCAVDVCTVPFRVGGDVVGLDAGDTVVLQLNGADDLTVNADGAFQFATILGHDSAYDVTVATQPAGENCTVTRGSGIIDDADIDDVLVACGPLRSIGGTVSGLAAGASVTLQNNGGDDLVVSANGSFAFANGVPDGFAYDATVLVQPTMPMQVCSISNGSGTATADVTSISVQCVTQSFAVGGTVSGLAPGNAVTLVNNGSDPVVVAADGSFAFATPVLDQGAYNVTVLSQPTSPNQVCTVAGGSGTIAGAPVSVAVSCVTQTYTVGGTVSGLAAGNSVQLLVNGGDALIVSANGGFAFATPLDDGSGYAVTVSVQPTDPDQTCSVTGGNGTLAGANVTSVGVSCVTQTHTVGGTVSGLAPGNGVTLVNNGGDALVVPADGGFTFATPVADGDAYLVAVSVQPTSPNQVCSVANGGGTIDGAAVTNVAVSCVTDTHTVGGNVAGLAPGNSVTLAINGGETVAVPADGSFVFPTALDDGSSYAVTVTTQPTDPDQTCTVGAGSGALNGANVTNIAVTCSTDTYAVGGTVSGLAAGNSVTLANSGGDALTVSANGAFVFATPVEDEGAYLVTVTTQPTTPNQTCTVANGSGTIDGADITSVAVTCVTQTYTIGGTVAGLAPGNSVTLTNNGGDALVVSADGAFAFATALDDGSGYAVAVSAQPTDPDQTCTVGAGSGTLSGANVTNIAVTCSTDTYTVGGSVSGLAAGNSVTLSNNGGDALVATNGPFVFAMPVADGAAYAVTVTTQPTSPNQTCTVANGSGTIDGADIGSVVVTCVTQAYTIGGTVAGLAPGNSVTLTNNGGDALVVSADGGFTFATALDDGSGYTVAVSAQPTDPDQTCTVGAGSGTLSGANVTNIAVTCSTDTYTVGGSVSGLAAGNSVTLANNGGDAVVVSSNGAFVFATPLADGSSYAVTVTTQPTSPNQTCTVANGSGTLGGADIASVLVTCATDTYSVGGTVSGLAAGTSVTLTNNGGDALVVSADGAFTFATALDDGSSYAVAVSVQPTSPEQTCSVTAGSGTLAGADVGNVLVSCATETYTVGGTVSGLAAGNSVTLTNNGGDALVVGADGSFTFATAVADGSAYAVAVSVQPTSPNQVCSVASGSGNLAGADVTSVSVTCVTEQYTVGGSVSGLDAGNSVTLTNNGGDTLVVSADGAFTFATALDDGSAYAVAVSVQPDGQSCSVAAGSGTLAGADVTAVLVDCAANTFTVTPSAGAGGALDPGAPQTVAEGETATFDVLADTGYDIAGVTGCDGSLGGTQYVTGAIDADCTVQATFVKRTLTGTTPGGPATASVGGDWVFAETGNGPMQSAGFIPASGHPKSPATLPADVEFPTGLIDFVLVEGQAGTTASVQIVFAQAVPAGAQFQVYGPSAGNPAPHWHVLPVTVAGNVVTLQPADGGNGDGDVSANAVIPLVGGFAVAQGVVDPPPASAPAVIPATSTWALLGLVVAMMLLGIGGVRAAGSRD